MKLFEKIKTIIYHPQDVEYLLYNRYISTRFPKLYSAYLFKRELGRRMDWNNPIDLDQKIAWMQFNTDTTEWSRLADKYAVREFVADQGCADILIPLYGKWDCIDDVDFGSLPKKYVIKTNCSCGDTCIINDKNTTDVETIKSRLKRAIDNRMGYDTAELHYLRIEPCIIAEKLLEPADGHIVDYKFYCFHGKPYCIFTGSNRVIEKHTVDFNVFTLDWQRRNDCMSEKYRNDVFVPKPHNLDKMIEYAEILSKPFPFVRVDLYDINGKIYFGEMTFTPKKGRQLFFTHAFSLELGKQLHLNGIR